MRLSAVINTCALGPKATVVKGSAGKTIAHTFRSYALRNWILPLYIDSPSIDEVVVVGEWETGSGYRYIEVPSQYFNCADALLQRQTGFQQAKGDFVIFQHDDHFFDMVTLALLDWDTIPDVLVPARWTRLRSALPERLNNGENQYIGGHGAIYRRDVIDACPWVDVNATFTWDVHHTEAIRKWNPKFDIEWRTDVKLWDVEFGGTPWR